MKLDTSKITDGVAIHCPKKEYVRELFDAMGWRNIETGERYWENYKENTCYTLDKGWHYSDRDWYQNHSYTIIPFTDLIIEEECNLIKALHGAGVNKRIKEDTEFEFSDMRFKVSKQDGCLYKFNEHSEYDEWNGADEWVVFLINEPENVKVITKWTLKEQEMAKKDNFRFKYVARDEITTLWNKRPEWDNVHKWFHTNGETIKIWDNDYPSLQPGEYVSLKEIAGGGE